MTNYFILFREISLSGKLIRKKPLVTIPTHLPASFIIRGDRWNDWMQWGTYSKASFTNEDNWNEHWRIQFQLPCLVTQELHIISLSLSLSLFLPSQWRWHCHWPHRVGPDLKLWYEFKSKSQSLTEFSLIFTRWQWKNDPERLIFIHSFLLYNWDSDGHLRNWILDALTGESDNQKESMQLRLDRIPFKWGEKGDYIHDASFHL